MADLLPCPFCGNKEPEIERVGTRRQSCIVVCDNCGVRHESSDEGEDSGASWNTRAQPAQAYCPNGDKCKHGSWCSETYCQEQCKFKEPAQAVPASCGECGKKTSDGWALYCVACMEKAGLPAVTGSPPLTHSCTSSLVRTADFTAQAVPLLTEREIVKCLTASGCVGTVKMSYDSGPYEITRTSINADRLAQAIESLVRSKLGAGVPMTRQQTDAMFEEVQRRANLLADEGRYTFGGWFPIAVELIEAHHGIVGKEGACCL